jgi:hypothetical protein
MHVSYDSLTTVGTSASQSWLCACHSVSILLLTLLTSIYTRMYICTEAEQRTQPALLIGESAHERHAQW